MNEKVLDHKTVEVNLGTIADAETDKALRELHSAEWDILRERIYKSMAAAIDWDRRFGGVKKPTAVCPVAMLGGNEEDEEISDSRVAADEALITAEFREMVDAAL
jgi:hypothetical protein